MHGSEKQDLGLDDANRRPRDLALLLLAIGGHPPRQRARDQQADQAGLELYRKVLTRLAELDPDPAEILAVLSRIVLEFGEPSGPTRGICLRMSQEWEECRASNQAWAWLIREAIDSAGGPPKKRRGHRPDFLV